MKLRRNWDISGQQDATITVTSLICSMGLLLCMIFAILGIKLKWFKHRLSFEQVPGTSSGRGGNNSASQNGSVVPLGGVFRRKEDPDTFIEIERPITLPPVRIRTTDVQIPIPNRQSQATFSLPTPQNVSQPPTPPPMPSSSTFTQRSDNRSQKSGRSQTSSRSKSSERGKRSDDQSTNSAKSSSSRKKKVHHDDLPLRHGKGGEDQPTSSSSKSSSSRRKKPQDEIKYAQPSTSSTSHYSEVNKKRRDKDKEKSRSPPAGASYEPKAKPRNAQAGAHFEQTRHFEKLKDDKQTTKGDKGSRIIERRPTGFVRPSDEEMEALEKLSEQEGKMQFKLDGFSDNDEESQQIFEKVKSMPVPEPRKRTSDEATSPSSPITSPVASVASKSNDSWSAVARHRILTEELTKQHSALKPVGMDLRSNGMNEYRNPLSVTPSPDNKPRTMRDMKRNKDVSTLSSQNDRVVLGQEQRDDTEA